MLCSMLTVTLYRFYVQAEHLVRGTVLIALLSKEYAIPEPFHERNFTMYSGHVLYIPSKPISTPLLQDMRDCKMGEQGHGIKLPYISDLIIM